MASDNQSLSNITNNKRGIIATFLGSIVFFVGWNQSGTNADAKLDMTAPAITFSSIVPKDINNPADPQQAAEFAWNEFIALNWPVQKNPSPTTGMSNYFRGKASATQTLGATGSGGVVVWETFYHRNELYPGYATGNGNVLPSPNAIPSYLYQTPITKATPNTNLNLFNNLDEASEITLANMYYTPLAEKADALRNSFGGSPTPAQQQLITNAGIKAALVYEAKGNPVMFNYLKSTGFNNRVPGSKARNQAYRLVTSTTPYKPTGPVFSLPNSTIEMKATWRHFDASTDNLNDFHWTIGIYYTGSSIAPIANNDTLLLVALHIIQKTPNVPTFTFATFEHVSNEKNGFRFKNTNPRTVNTNVPRPLPDSGIITASRQFPIPNSSSKFDLVSYNTMVQNQMRKFFGNKVVWANYQLIGVQAVVQNDPGGVVPDQQFFLSNFATETNNTLQFFQGGLTGPSTNVPGPNEAHVFVINPKTKIYKGYTSGGCLGCHGSQGQFKGGDFSVISATANGFSPEPILTYPGGKVSKQNPAGFPLPH
jgi:hypothetical protein